jgi:hypothetical protein
MNGATSKDIPATLPPSLPPPRVRKYVRGTRLEAVTSRQPLPPVEGTSVLSAALRLGQGAATAWAIDERWNDELEQHLRVAWQALRPDVGWATAGPIIRQGWEQARARVAGARAAHVLRDDR